MSESPFLHKIPGLLPEFYTAFTHCSLNNCPPSSPKLDKLLKDLCYHPFTSSLRRLAGFSLDDLKLIKDAVCPKFADSGPDGVPKTKIDIMLQVADFVLYHNNLNFSSNLASLMPAIAADLQRMDLQHQDALLSAKDSAVVLQKVKFSLLQDALHQRQNEIHKLQAQVANLQADLKILTAKCPLPSPSHHIPAATPAAISSISNKSDPLNSAPLNLGLKSTGTPTSSRTALIHDNPSPQSTLSHSTSPSAAVLSSPPGYSVRLPSRPASPSSSQPDVGPESLPPSRPISPPSSPHRLRRRFGGCGASPDKQPFISAAQSFVAQAVFMMRATLLLHSFCGSHQHPPPIVLTWPR
jgi:hypothetical protein